MRHGSFVIIAILLFLLPKQVFSDPGLAFQSFPYLGLGEDFAISVSVKPEPSAQLAFFNFELAKRLGIEFPEDPRLLKDWAVKNFAWRTAGDFGFKPVTREDLWESFVRRNQGQSADFFRVQRGDPFWAMNEELTLFKETIQAAASVPRTTKLMGTFYLDSLFKAPGKASGDGRALYVGECVGCGSDGENLDVQIKGVGVTPLAWTEDKDHSDGRLTQAEAKHSMAMSSVLNFIGVHTTEDLMILKLQDGSALSVRVGNHFRPAHIAYHFEDTNESMGRILKFRKWIVNRVLSRKADARVTKIEIEKFFTKSARRLGESCASMEAWNIVHTSPTKGNFTLDGGITDIGSLRIMDSARGNYTYGPSINCQMKWKEQTEHIRELFVEEVVEPLMRFDAESDEIRAVKIFRSNFQEGFKARLWTEIAKRIGLTVEQAEKVNEKIKKEWIEFYRSLMNQRLIDRNRLLSSAMTSENWNTADIVGRRNIPEKSKASLLETLRSLKSLTKNTVLNLKLSEIEKKDALNRAKGIPKLYSPEGGKYDYQDFHARLSQVNSNLGLEERSADLVTLFFNEPRLNLSSCAKVFSSF